MHLESICMNALPVVKEAGMFVAENRRQIPWGEIEKKGDRDFVTSIDKKSERLLVKGLSAILPEAGFFTEEKTVEQGDSSLRWVVDPIDGTTNFIHRTPVTAVSVALMDGDDLLIGIVYEVTLDELFYSWKDAGTSFCNSEEIHVSDCSEFRKALVATGFPYQREGRLPAILETAGYFLEHCQDIRRFGSAATDLCYVACGRMDIYYESYLQLWDVAAGILIVRNAGGTVVDFSGSEHLTGQQVLATNGRFIEESLSGIRIPPITR